MISLLKNIFNYFKPTPILYVAFDSGGKRKPTIVLLHGVAATSKTWDLLLNELDVEKYRVIALDLLGFGESPKPVDCDYLASDHVKSVRKTLRKLKIRQPFKLVGHSMGSIIAANYGRHYPWEIEAEYLLSLPLYPKEPELHTSISRAYTDIFIKSYELLMRNKAFTIKSSSSIRKLLKISDGIDVTEETWDSFRLSLKNTIINQNTFDDIKNTALPVHIIYGAFDEFLVQDNIARLSDFHNVIIKKVPAADHSINLRFAREVAKILNDSKKHK